MPFDSVFASRCLPLVSSCPSFISVAVIKHPDEKLLREERVCSVHDSKLQSITVRKPRENLLLLVHAREQRENKHLALLTCLCVFSQLSLFL